MTEPFGSWKMKDARANFGALVERAISDGPQIVTGNGKKTVIVVSAEEWERRNRRGGDLVDFFANSPLREKGMKIARVSDYPRDIEL